MYQEFLDNIIALSQQNVGGIDITPIIGLTQEINNLEPNGRIVVNLQDNQARGSLGIQEGDSLIVPEKTSNVYVYGEVSSEGSVMYAPNEKLIFLLINLVVIKNMLIMNLYIFFILTERHKDISQREEIF